MARITVNANALRKNSDAYLELFNNDKLQVFALKGGRFEVVCGSTHIIAHSMQEISDKVDGFELHACPISGQEVIASIQKKLGSQYRLEIHAAKDEGTKVVHAVEGSKEYLANQMLGSIPVDVACMNPGQRYTMSQNMFGGDYAVLIPMSCIGLPELSPSLSPNQMWETQPLTKGDVIQGIDPIAGSVVKIMVSNAYPNGSIQDSTGKIYSADEVCQYQFCKVQDSPAPSFSEPDLPLYESENIPSYNPTGEVEKVAPMIGNLANYNTILEASGGILGDFMKKAGKFALADRCSLNKIRVSGIDKKGQATDGELEWNVKIASPYYKRSSLITIPMTMVKGNLELGKYFISSTGQKFPLTIEALDAHLGRLADDPLAHFSKKSSHPSTLKCDADIDAICEAVKTAGGEYQSDVMMQQEAIESSETKEEAIQKLKDMGYESTFSEDEGAEPETIEECVARVWSFYKDPAWDELNKEEKARKFADENFGPHDDDGNPIKTGSKKTAVDSKEVAETIIEKDKPLDNIPGGKAEGKKPSQFDRGQFEKGIKVEMEHSTDPQIAAEIATDHLAESEAHNEEYYDKLETKVEKPLEQKAEASKKVGVYKNMDELRGLWKEFGYIPVDDDGNIEVPFLYFEKGTNREEIWHWFEEQNPEFVAGKEMYASKEVVAWDFTKGQDIKVGDTVSYGNGQTGKVISVTRVQDVYADEDEFEANQEIYGNEGLSWEGNEVMTVDVGDDESSTEKFVYEVKKVGSKKTAADWSAIKDAIMSSETKEDAVKKLNDSGYKSEDESNEETINRLWDNYKETFDPSKPENRASALIDEAIKNYIESLPKDVEGEPNFYEGEDGDSYMSEDEIPDEDKEMTRAVYTLDTLSSNQGFEYFKDTLVSAVRDEISEEELPEDDLEELVSNWDTDLSTELPENLGVYYGKEPGDITVVLYKDLEPTQEDIMKERERAGQQVVPGLERGKASKK